MIIAEFPSTDSGLLLDSGGGSVILQGGPGAILDGSRSAPAVDPAAERATPSGLPGTMRTEEQAISACQANYGLRADGAPGGENEYQCVSWVWFRLRELGYDGPGGGPISGDGGVLASNLDGDPSTVPKPGAVMSYGIHAIRCPIMAAHHICSSCCLHQ